MSISFSITGDAVEKLTELKDKLDKGLARGMQLAGTYMERETKLNFDRETDPDGGGWAPLAASTVARKGSSKILTQSGNLKGGIALTSVSKERAVVQSTGPFYNIYHATGTSKMPQRQFIGIGARHQQGIEKIFKSIFE